jgi:hypothetical protein
VQLLKLEVLVVVYAEDNTDADGDLEVCWAFTGMGLHLALLFTISTVSSNTKECELHVKHCML